MAGDRKIAQVNGNSMNGHKVNDENISDNVNRTVLEELKNLENFVFDDMDFFDEVSFCFEIAKDYWMFFSKINLRIYSMLTRFYSFNFSLFRIQLMIRWTYLQSKDV